MNLRAACLAVVGDGAAAAWDPRDGVVRRGAGRRWAGQCAYRCAELRVYAMQDDAVGALLAAAQGVLGTVFTGIDSHPPGALLMWRPGLGVGLWVERRSLLLCR